MFNRDYFGLNGDDDRGVELVPETHKFLEAVPVSRIFLSLNNPRHAPVETEGQAIERLCEKEDVYPLAKDIVKHGLSPLERFAVVAVERRKVGAKPKVGASNPTYWVAEGNRRICALKLLSDPDLAPAKFRKGFEKLSDKWSPISTVHAAVFPSVESVRPWLDRVHSGPQGGIGRRSWDSEQKQRFYGGSKNRSAQALLDYAEAENMITKDEREGKLTTAQRFLNNDVFREAVGFDASDPEEYGRTRPKAEFDILVRRFMRDLASGKDVNSRMNKPHIIDYARPLNALPGVTTTRIEAEPLASDNGGGSSKKRTRRQPRKPEKAKHVRFEEGIYSALKALGNEKLESLYYSLCSIELERHTPILSIGAWSFFETLTACAGRTGATSFDSYLNKNKLNAYGLGKDTVSLRAAVARMREYGNTTKHHRVAGTFNGDQLNNDMVALKDVILACIADAASKKAP